MLTKKQVEKIKEHLEKAQNPLFFFDNDPDGLCSFLLLQRFLGRGKGIPVRSFPGLNKDYFRRVRELDADYIFILDKPMVDKDFFDEVRQVNIPIVWIDHHEIEKKNIPKFVNYFNPLFNRKKSSTPVTALCYQITERKEDLWLAVAGCIADRFLPEFYTEFKKVYPDLSGNFDDAFSVFYKTGIGKIARIFSFSLMDRTTNVINMLKFLMKVKNPYEVLEETSKNFRMHERFKEIEKRKSKLLEKAMKNFSESRVLFFQYGGDMSVSGELANELSYKFPEKVVVVVYLIGTKANISVRGEKIRENVLSAIEGLENSSGGGHENAIGAQVLAEDIGKFKERLYASFG